jgi:NodT family efflux transporter outer membrane factor (OMF) lipoprotein
MADTAIDIRPAPRVTLCVLLAALGLSGCMVGPDYRRPDAPVPVTYKELEGFRPATPADGINRGAWWSIYNDPELDQLEREVIISNQNVKSFEATYRASVALVQETQAQLFPSIAVTPQVTHGRSGSGRGFATSSGTVIGGAGSGTVSTNYSVQASGDWAPDLWGKIRRQVESNVAAAQVSGADLANALLSAQATLATDYMNLRYEDSLKQLLQQTVAAYQRTLEITQNQYRAGTASSADVVTADAQLKSAQALLIAVGVARGQYEHAIAMLIGRPPAELSIPEAPLPTAVPVVPTDVPSTLLERRPDIAAAERQMQEENALIGVAKAAYYPDVTLSALVGFSGNMFSELFRVANEAWSLGAAATETVFDAGERAAAVRGAEATYDQSVANYRQTVLTAFQQVEDELVALRVLQQQAVAQAAAVAAGQRAVEVTLNQYRAGTVAYTSVVTEQTLLLGNQQTALGVQQSRLTASVGLIEALGGGWQAGDLPSGNEIAHIRPARLLEP